MSDPRDYKLDLQAAGAEPGAEPRTAEESPRTAVRRTTNDVRGAQRPYLSVYFACCGVYQRVYRCPDGKAYVGRCPRCAVPVRFVVGPGGTAARSFVVR